MPRTDSYIYLNLLYPNSVCFLTKRAKRLLWRSVYDSLQIFGFLESLVSNWALIMIRINLPCTHSIFTEGSCIFVSRELTRQEILTTRKTAEFDYHIVLKLVTRSELLITVVSHCMPWAVICAGLFIWFGMSFCTGDGQLAVIFAFLSALAPIINSTLCFYIKLVSSRPRRSRILLPSFL